MYCWIFWRVLVSSIILIKFSECCAIPTDRPIEEVMKKNEDSPWLVLIGDITVQRYEEGLINGNLSVPLSSNIILHSASLIIPDHVFRIQLRSSHSTKNDPYFSSRCIEVRFTCNDDDGHHHHHHYRSISKYNVCVLRTPEENLIVITHCLVENGVNCDVSPVTSIHFPDNFDRNDFKEDEVVILLLSTPLELSATISPVRLANKNDDFDRDDCVIHHWKPIVSIYWGKENIKGGNVISIKSIYAGLNRKAFGRILLLLIAWNLNKQPNSE